MRRVVDARAKSRSVGFGLLVALLALPLFAALIIIHGARQTHGNARPTASSGEKSLEMRRANPGLSDGESVRLALATGQGRAGASGLNASGWPLGPPGVPRLLHQVWLVRRATNENERLCGRTQRALCQISPSSVCVAQL